MSISLTPAEKGADHTIIHDLNFQKNHYDAKHVIVGPLPCLVLSPLADMLNFQDIQEPEARALGYPSRKWARTWR